jgi:hypothetical protein
VTKGREKAKKAKTPKQGKEQRPANYKFSYKNSNYQIF